MDTTPFDHVAYNKTVEEKHAAIEALTKDLINFSNAHAAEKLAFFEKCCGFKTGDAAKYRYPVYKSNDMKVPPEWEERLGVIKIVPDGQRLYYAHHFSLFFVDNISKREHYFCSPWTQITKVNS